MAEPSWLVRVVEWFEKDPGKRLLGTSELRGASLEELLRLWEASSNDPMVEMFRVSEKQRPQIERWANVKVDLGRADYFIAAYARDLEASRASGGYMGQFPPPLVLSAFPEANAVKPRAIQAVASQTLSWGDTVRIAPSAPSQMRPGTLASVVAMSSVEGKRADAFNVPEGTLIITVEFADGSSVELPAALVERVRD